MHATIEQRTILVTSLLRNWKMVCRLLAVVILISGAYNLFYQTYRNPEFAQLGPEFLRIAFTAEVAYAFVVLLWPVRFGATLSIVYAVYSIIALYWWGSNQNRCPCLGPVSISTPLMSFLDASIVVAFFVYTKRPEVDKSVRCARPIARFALASVVIMNSFILLAVAAAENNWIPQGQKYLAFEIEEGAIVRGSLLSSVRFRVSNVSGVTLEKLRFEADCGCASIGELSRTSLKPSESTTFDVQVHSEGIEKDAHTKHITFTVYGNGGITQEILVSVPVMTAVADRTSSRLYELMRCSSSPQKFQTVIEIDPSFKLQDVTSLNGIRVSRHHETAKEDRIFNEITWELDEEWKAPSWRDSLELTLIKKQSEEIVKIAFPLAIAERRMVEVLDSNGFLGNVSLKKGFDIDFIVTSCCGVHDPLLKSVKCQEQSLKLVHTIDNGERQRVTIKAKDPSRSLPSLQTADIEFHFEIEDTCYVETVPVRWLNE